MSKPEYELVPTDTFLVNIRSLTKKSKQIIKKKLLLIKRNPFRFKRLSGFDYPTFRVRVNIDNKDKRIIYVIFRDNKVYLVCILDRNNNYTDLTKYLEKEGLI